MAASTPNTTSNVNVNTANTPPQNEGYLNKFTSNLGTILGNRSVQILSGGSLLGTYLGRVGGASAIDALVRTICAKGIGGLTGKAVASIAAPALTNYLGNTVMVLGGASGAATIMTLYFTANGVYYIVKNVASKLGGSENPQTIESGVDPNPSIELDFTQEEETDIGEFTVLKKV